MTVRHNTKSKGKCATISIPTLYRLRLHSIVCYSTVWWMQTAQASYSGEAQHHRQGMCASISIPTLERLRLYSIVSHSTVWWIQAAQASGETHQHSQGRSATIGNPTPERLRGLALTPWPVQLQRISNMQIGKGYDSSAV